MKIKKHERRLFWLIEALGLESLLLALSKESSILTWIDSLAIAGTGIAAIHTYDKASTYRAYISGGNLEQNILAELSQGRVMDATGAAIKKHKFECLTYIALGAPIAAVLSYWLLLVGRPDVMAATAILSTHMLSKFYNKFNQYGHILQRAAASKHTAES